MNHEKWVMYEKLKKAINDHCVFYDSEDYDALMKKLCDILGV